MSQIAFDKKELRQIIKLYIIVIYIIMIPNNFSFILSFDDYGGPFAVVANLIILSLVCFCGRYNSKLPVVYFFTCCLWGIASYISHVNIYNMTMEFSSRGFINSMLILPSSSLAGTMVALFPDNDIANTIQLSLVIQPIAIIISYIVGRYIRKRKQAVIANNPSVSE